MKARAFDVCYMWFCRVFLEVKTTWGLDGSDARSLSWKESPWAGMFLGWVDGERSG
jgi:hypothetical protein